MPRDRLRCHCSRRKQTKGATATAPLDAQEWTHPHQMANDSSRLLASLRPPHSPPFARRLHHLPFHHPRESPPSQLRRASHPAVPRSRPSSASVGATALVVQVGSALESVEVFRGQVAVGLAQPRRGAARDHKLVRRRGPRRTRSIASGIECPSMRTRWKLSSVRRVDFPLGVGVALVVEGRGHRGRGSSRRRSHLPLFLVAAPLLRRGTQGQSEGRQQRPCQGGNRLILSLHHLPTLHLAQSRRRSIQTR